MTLFYIIAAIVFSILILNSSASKDEKQTKDEIAKMSTPPEHAIVSGSPSPAAIVLSVIVVIVLCIAATHGMS